MISKYTKFIVSFYLLIFSSTIFAGFSDVSLENNFKDAIFYAQKNNIVNGYSDGTFKPEKEINRAEFTKIIINSAFDEKEIFGKNCFPDIQNQWFAKYVCTAKRKGIIKGYPNGTFKPANEISFAEAAKIVILSLGDKVNEGNKNWYEPFVEQLSMKNYIPPTINNINKKITRGEMVELIWRELEDVKTRDFADYYEGELWPEEAYTEDDFVEAEFDDNYFYDDENPDDIDLVEDNTCSEFEYFDEETQSCELDCETDEACEVLLDEMDTAWEDLGDEYDDFAKDFTEFEGDSADLDQESNAIYEVQPGEKFVLKKGENKEIYQKIKEWLAIISPNKLSDKYLNHLEFYKDQSGSAMAFVEQVENTEKWNMFINTDVLVEGEKEMLFTVIHEFAHILTLNVAQMEGPVTPSCKNFLVGEGCLKRESYLNKFYQRFWKNSGLEERPADSYDNYSKKSKAFVDEYAATNPGEDIAETFASFVFKKRIESPKTIAEKKINFFYKYPELVKIRENIRKKLQSFVRKRIRR